MNKCASEIYANLVAAPIGVPVSTRHKNGKEYNFSIEDVLTQQGYKNGVDFERIFDWGTAQTFFKKLVDIRPYEEPKHNIQIGDIFYNSWGYDQTNIDFYQVVATTAKTISLRRISSATTDSNDYQMSGRKIALRDRFVGTEVLRKTPYLFSGVWHISFEYGAGCAWDGTPMSYSWYA